MTTSPPPLLAPVPDPARIHAIDAVRGFALLGILLVNIQAFGEAFGELIRSHPAPGAPPDEIGAFYFVKVFCESKFYPLFSMLFGMGLMLQWQRAAAAGRGFLAPGFRRLSFLIVLGAAHALLVWYGDILFEYGVCGIVLLLMARARPRTLAITGSALLLVAVVVGAAFGVLLSLSPEAAPGATTEAAVTAAAEPPRFDRPFDRLMEAFQKNEVTDGPETPIWMQTEAQAYRYGPYDQLFKMRAMSWLMFLVFSCFGFGWHVLAMFMFGAAFLKAGLFTPEKQAWRRRLAQVGFGVGLPLNILAFALPYLLPEKTAEIIMIPLVFIGGPLLSLGYLGLISILVERGIAPRLFGAIANVGRMALTNYLIQSLIATTIFYYYGLGLFDQTTRVQRLGIVLAVYLVQIGFSNLWLRHFRFGPMEWLWRSFTYLRPQPLRRA